jgi:hypothetical protein
MNWGNVWESYLAMIGVAVTLYAVYKLFGHDLVGFK